MRVPLIVTSGDKWVGYGFRSFHSIINELIRTAEQSVSMTVYVISDMSVIESIREAIKKGVNAEIFLYSPENLGKSEALEELSRLSKKYENLTVHNVRDKVLHAKVLVADDLKVLIGSANPTTGGMLKNYELGLLVEDGKLAQDIQMLLRRLLK